MSKRVHQILVQRADSINSKLSQALMQIKPLSLTPQRNICLAEHLCRSIAGQQLSVKAAHCIWSRVLERGHGEPLMNYFSRSSPQQLRRCGLSNAKCRAIKQVSRFHSRGMLDRQVLQKLSTDERNSRLESIWGVGQWTADMMNIFHFGDKDVWPDGDLAVRNTLLFLTSPQEDSKAVAEHFAPYRSFLALYMWKFVNTQLF